jgi:alkyl sulfatase BDS1-like metallo-beta-lactamase superfamily hydrolase
VRLRDAVQYVHDATVEGMNEGKDVYTLMREIRLPDELAVGEGYGKVSWDVRAIWEGYAGWFHHRSTTELYPVPPASVHPEIVELAGGPDAVAERALRRVVAGEPCEAIHLAEMALAADPKHRPALEALLAAHELLLERAGTANQGPNFWEVRWLEQQIANTRAALGPQGSK